MKCPLCDRSDLKNTRALHAHMLKSHLEEYRARGCKLSAFGVKPETPVKSPVPDDFRPLNLNDPMEAAAYEAGYRYFSGEMVYKPAECKKRGWIK